MITKKEFYFIRHGQTDYNLLGDKVDHPDISLNACGKKQAEKMQSLIASLPLNAICFSPFRRAQETKNILASNLVVKQHEIVHLGECSLDVWQEMTTLGIEAVSCKSPHVQKFMQQVISGINQALDKEGPVLVVAHGGIHWALCCLMNVEHEWIIDNCVPVHFYYEENKWVAKKLTC
jgi:probable phosphoglycerate mutase